MSTGADCQFHEVKPGKWTYRLQQYPYGASEDYDTFGPFNSYKAANKHLNDNHANPGGSASHSLPEGQHVHEYSPGAQVITGITVQIEVKSLGPSATKEDAIKRIQSLPVDHPAFKTWPTWGYDEKALACEPCGALKPG